MYQNCYVSVCPCSMNAAEMKRREKMTEGLEKIQDALLGFSFPKPVIQSAMKKIRHEGCAQEWLSQQGQYYYVYVCVHINNCQAQYQTMIQCLCVRAVCVCVCVCDAHKAVFSLASNVALIK